MIFFELTVTEELPTTDHIKSWGTTMIRTIVSTGRTLYELRVQTESKIGFYHFYDERSMTEFLVGSWLIYMLANNSTNDPNTALIFKDLGADFVVHLVEVANKNYYHQLTLELIPG